MKKVLEITCVAIIITIAASGKLYAQGGEARFDLNWNYSMPVGNFKNTVISNGSPRGGNGDLMFGINSFLSVGLSSGYQDYYQKYPRSLYATSSNEVTSAVLTNSIQAVPIMAKLAYMPLGNKWAPIEPYITGAVGIDILSVNEYLGEFGSNDNSSSFIAQGGAGIFVPFGKLSAAGLRFGADFNYVPYNKYGFGNLNTVDLHAGIYVPLR